MYAAPTHTVIGGPEAAVERDRRARRGRRARSLGVLQTKGAGHTSQMDPLLGELAAELAGIEPTKLKVGLYSTVDKETFYRAGHEPIHDVDYWVKNMRHSVYFTNAVRLAVEHRAHHLPGTGAESRCADAGCGHDVRGGLHDAQLIRTLKRKEDESAGVLARTRAALCHGHAVDLASLLARG